MIKLLKENTGVNLSNLELGNGFLDITSKARRTKGKRDKLDYSKIKNIFAVNYTIRK